MRLSQSDLLQVLVQENRGPANVLSYQNKALQVGTEVPTVNMQQRRATP